MLKGRTSTLVTNYRYIWQNFTYELEDCCNSQVGSLLIVHLSIHLNLRWSEQPIHSSQPFKDQHLQGVYFCVQELVEILTKGYRTFHASLYIAAFLLACSLLLSLLHTPKVSLHVMGTYPLSKKKKRVNGTCQQ